MICPQGRGEGTPDLYPGKRRGTYDLSPEKRRGHSWSVSREKVGALLICARRERWEGTPVLYPRREGALLFCIQGKGGGTPVLCPGRKRGPSRSELGRRRGH